VRSVGVASAAAALALGVAGTASACQISDFTTSVSCDHQSGKGVISVTDKDGSGTPASVTVSLNGASVGSAVPIAHPTADGSTVVIPVTWTPGATYTVHVTAGQPDQKLVVDEDIPGGATIPSDQKCETTKPPTSPAAPPTVPSKPGAPATPGSTASASASASAAAVADASSPSPSATGNLAETGGGSNTGMIAGIAGALVIVGGGAVFGLRRRGATARH
jgi:hypothetical protein